MRAVWGVRDGARVHGVADRVSRSCEGGQFGRRRPTPPRRSSGNRGVITKGEDSSALLCEAEGAEARERGWTRAGGLGGPGNGEARGVQRRHGVGEVGEEGFAENPWLLSFSFLSFVFQTRSFSRI